MEINDNSNWSLNLFSILKNGKIDDTKQVNIGDCWLLSGLNALSYTKEGSDIIRNSLEYKDDYTIVHLDAAGDFAVSDEELNKALNENNYSSGDIDMVVFELAFEKLRQKVLDRKIIVNAKEPELPFLMSIMPKEYYDENELLYAGSMSEPAYFLTSKESEFVYNTTKQKEMLEKFKANNNQNYALCAVMDENEVKDSSGQDTQIFDEHVYAVKKLITIP